MEVHEGDGIGGDARLGGNRRRVGNGCREAEDIEGLEGVGSVEGGLELLVGLAARVGVVAVGDRSVGDGAAASTGTVIVFIGTSTGDGVDTLRYGRRCHRRRRL